MERDRALALGVALLVEAAALAWFASLKLDGRADVRSGADGLQVVFVRRIASSREAVASKASGPLRRRPTAVPLGVGANARKAPGGAGMSVEPVAAPPRPLDLHVPESALSPPAARADAFDRPPALETRTTRFERAWMPAGNALEQASFRSAVVRGALGLFGGPPRRCSEVERRLRKINCLPLHGQEQEDEVLRRSVDR